MKASRKPQHSVKVVPEAATAILMLTSFSFVLSSQIEVGSKVLGPFCGEKSPEPINTQTHNVSIRFRSDNSGENRGWKLSYQAAGNFVLVLSPHGAPWLRDEEAPAWDSSEIVVGLPALPLVQQGTFSLLIQFLFYIMG